MFQESGNSFLDKVSNLSDQPLLAAATHSDASPTPPHISQKVVALSRASSHKCVFVMQHLLELAQSSSKSLASRIKAVRLMQELVLKGDPAFQQLLQKEEHKLKPVGNFLDQRAPLESSRLREAVSDLLEVLFEENFRAPNPLPLPLSSPPPFLGASRPDYQGFGNPHFANRLPNSTGSSFSSGFSSSFSAGSGVMNQVSGKMSEILSRVPPPDPNRFIPRESAGYGPRSGAGTEYAQNDTFYSGVRTDFRSGPSLHHQLPSANPHIPGVAGGEWTNGYEESVAGEKLENGLAEERGSGNLERHLVVEFVSAGGVRGKPTRQEVDELLGRSRSLDSSLLVSHTISHLQSQSTASKLKCIFLLEALYTSSPELLAPLLIPHSRLFQTIAQSGESPALRNKAREFLSALGFSSSPDPERLSSPKADLIDTRTDEPASSQPPPDTRTEESASSQPPPDTGTRSGDEGSLFNGMLTSQESKVSEGEPLIAGFEDLNLPEHPSVPASSDMIELGPAQDNFSFDPLLDPSRTPPTGTNQSLPNSFMSQISSIPQNQSLHQNQSFPQNQSLHQNQSFPQNQSLHQNQSFPQNQSLHQNQFIPQIQSFPQNQSLLSPQSHPISAQSGFKPEERTDSFGFISEHIRTIKDSKN